MAPAISHVHKLVVRNVKLLKAAWKSVQQQVQSRLAPTLEPIPIPIRITSRQPIHRLAAFKQNQNRWYSTSVRHITTSSKGAAPRIANKAAWPTSATRTAVTSLTHRAPFASTLRPNLTGGTLNRTAGGYSLGSGRIGGARHFSHTPAAPAQVVQNVSQAVRAFLLSGQKAQFAGTDPRTGEKRYRAVSALQDSTSRKVAKLPIATPGSYIDFRVNPTITALTPLSAIAGYAGFSGSEEVAEKQDTITIDNLNTSGLLDVLSVDFSRALKDLAAILNDLKALSQLGDLPITYRTDAAPTLRVHFPGCDGETVESLCRELGVKRGLVVQDDRFDAYAGTEIALLFPFAPSEGSEISYGEPEAQHYFKHQPEDVWRDDLLFPSPRGSQCDSTRSESGYELFDAHENADLSPVSAFDSGRGRFIESPATNTGSSPLEYQDFEGIYRFIELCDDSRR